ncbi:dehydrogenase [Sphingomonas sp. DBB INV C78]|uniref:MaoC/PaaZ C-terminal domain-containing protein n=1 Tax=Sphingomonas sp. DBB INV C78 TaxID=3349434 RepID=UPI0036D3D7F3
MPLEYPAILSMRENGRRLSYDHRDVMLYALGIGMGRDPLNEKELRFTYERDLQAVPSLATMIAWHAGCSTADLGLDYRQVLHGQEEIILHRPLPASAQIIVDSDIAQVYDKGPGKGAIVVRRTVVRTASDHNMLCEVNRTIFARGDGGRGGSPDPAPIPHAVPMRAPDTSIMMTTRSDQATLYRLCGDRNPLHIDPEAARSAGFDRPILHGLCTFGMTCRAVLQAVCGYDPSRIASHAARFAAPVYPGETVRIDLWQDGDIVSFEASVPERASTVIRNGKTQLRTVP